MWVDDAHSTYALANFPVPMSLHPTAPYIPGQEYTHGFRYDAIQIDWCQPMWTRLLQDWPLDLPGGTLSGNGTMRWTLRGTYRPGSVSLQDDGSALITAQPLGFY